MINLTPYPHIFIDKKPKVITSIGVGVALPFPITKRRLCCSRSSTLRLATEYYRESFSQGSSVAAFADGAHTAAGSQLGYPSSTILPLPDTLLISAHVCHYSQALTRLNQYLENPTALIAAFERKSLRIEYL